MSINRPHLGFEITVQDGPHYEIVQHCEGDYGYLIDNGKKIIEYGSGYETAADAFRGARNYMKRNQDVVFK